MQVFILSRYVDNGNIDFDIEIVGVFSSEERAKAYAAWNDIVSYDISSYTVQ